MKMLNSNRCKVFLNISLCLLSCILSITDSINCWEYILTSKFYSNFLKITLTISAILHPFSLFLYNCISLTYIYYLDDDDFRILIAEKEFYEMIYFRRIIKKYSTLLIPVAFWLTGITYTKFFSLYSMKFLIEAPSSYEVFFNVITTTLYNPIIIQIIFQSFPQIILQTTNNLLNMEHNHSFHMKGVVNFSTMTSFCLIISLSLLYLRDKKQMSDDQESNNSSDVDSSTAKNELSLTIGNYNKINRNNHFLK